VLRNYGILIDVAMVNGGAERIKPRFERRRFRQVLPHQQVKRSAESEDLQAAIRAFLARFDAFKEDEVGFDGRIRAQLDAIAAELDTSSYASAQTHFEETVDDADSIRTLPDGYESSEAWEPAGGWDAADAGPSGAIREALNELRQQEHHASHATRGDTRSRAVKRRSDFAPLAGELPKNARYVRGRSGEQRRSERLAGKRKAGFAPSPEEHPKDGRFHRGRADEHRRSERLAGKRKADLAALTEDHGTQDRRQMRRSGHEN
jgi:hypothetical protein